MYRRSSDSDREGQSGSMGGRESSGSMHSSPVETIHRQVGNQAVQSGYAEEEYSEPAGNGSTRVAGWQSVTIPGVSIPDQHGPQRMPDKHGPQRMPDKHGPQRMPDRDGPLKADRHGPMKTERKTGGTGDTAVPGWQSVTIPGKSVAPGATGAAGQQVSGDREIERVKNRLWTQFESIIDDTLR